MQDFDLRFSATAAQFFTATVTTIELLREQMLNTVMGYLGAAYKIDEVTVAPNGLVLTLGANAYNQDA